MKTPTPGLSLRGDRRPTKQSRSHFEIVSVWLAATAGGPRRPGVGWPNTPPLHYSSTPSESEYELWSRH
jgi:hypothetical protein